MACGDPCNNNPIHYNNPFKKKADDCGCIDCKQIIFTGAELTCTGITTNSNLEDILLAMDAQICSVIGDYSNYNFHCLSNDYVITTEAQFVSAITEQFCNLKDTYNSFTTTTYPTAINNLQTQINQIVSPNLTLCSGSGILTTDNYPTIITKLANGVCSLQTSQNVSTANWNQCFATSPLPNTIVEGFNVVLNQICTIQGQLNNQVTLPTFNNQGSCLPSPGTADTLVNTINKIKTRLCQSPIYDIDSSPWGCVVNPATGSGPNIQAAFDQVLPVVNNLYANRYLFDTNQFNLTPNGGSCGGYTITLDPSIGIEDRFVAATPSDTNPGTLSDKLQEGTNITLDYTDPEKVVINSTFTDQLVKVNSSDPTSGYLASKVTGGTNNGVTISTNVVSNQILIQPTVDLSSLWNNLVTFIQSDINAYQALCNLVCGCAPCDTTTTTTAPPSSTVRMYIENQSTILSANINVTLTQNAPTVAFLNTSYTLLPSGAQATPYYPLTTTAIPNTVSLTLENPDFATKGYDIDVYVYQGSSGPLVPGSSSTTVVKLTTYNNTNFSIGNLSGDTVIKVTIKNVVAP